MRNLIFPIAAVVAIAIVGISAEKADAQVIIRPGVGGFVPTYGIGHGQVIAPRTSFYPSVGYGPALPMRGIGTGFRHHSAWGNPVGVQYGPVWGSPHAFHRGPVWSNPIGVHHAPVWGGHRIPGGWGW